MLGQLQELHQRLTQVEGFVTTSTEASASLDSQGKARINLHHSSLPYVKGLTEQQVLDAQKKWGDGIVAISKAKLDNANFKEVAEDYNVVNR